MNINREIVRQIVKESVASQPEKMKLWQKLLVANQLLQKSIAPVKLATPDQRQKGLTE